MVAITLAIIFVMVDEADAVLMMTGRLRPEG